MSIAVGSAILWSDITALYSSLNTQRSRWGRGGAVSPTQGGQGVTAKAVTANTFINFFNDIRNHSQAASYLTWQPQVSVGALIQAAPFIKMRDQLAAIGKITPCSCHGFSFRDCNCNNFDADGSNDFSDMFRD